MDTNLLPLGGMNTVSDDDALQVGGDAPRLYVRDAVNFEITETGRARLRAGVRKVTTTPYRWIWQSPLHGDVFGVLGEQWVRIDPTTWTHEALAVIGAGPAFHEVVNASVVVAGAAGLFVFDGSSARRLTLDSPAPPMVVGSGSGALPGGTYGVAVAWLRGQQESPLSAVAFAEVEDGGRIQVTFPLCLDATVTGLRMYITRQNGGELTAAGDFAVPSPSIDLPALPDPGRPAQFRHLSPMPSGAFLRYWRGRLLTARANVLRWSESLAFHLHDERHGFLLMPQRITFVEPVDGGIWVGQADHVAFIQGASPDGFDIRRVSVKPPIPGSSLRLSAEAAGELGQGGAPAVAWLAENGYVIGTSSGAAVEMHGKLLRGVSGLWGSSILRGIRMLTAVST